MTDIDVWNNWLRECGILAYNRGQSNKEDLDEIKKLKDFKNRYMEAKKEMEEMCNELKEADSRKNDKITKHQKLCNGLHEIYKQKNAAYGDSFGDTFQKLGIISAVTRISDKYNRIVNLATHTDIEENDESIVDTLMDMANYCLMTIIELEKKK